MASFHLVLTPVRQTALLPRLSLQDRRPHLGREV